MIIVVGGSRFDDCRALVFFESWCFTNSHSKLLFSRLHAVDNAQAEVDPFVADVTRLLLTFFSVVAIDVVIVSLASGRLRFWFPLWLDPEWHNRSDPWVVYSQSYFAGIFMIPLLCRAIHRDFFATTSLRVRAIFSSLWVIVFALVLWWKGSLMLEYHKYYETLGWAFLTAVIWTTLRWVGFLPAWARGLTRRRMLQDLLFWIALFCLVMSVVDPALQLWVRRLPWSAGLAIEMAFFVPAGVVLLMLSRRLQLP